jgi:Kef-type K+ transport system membrane component KefB
MQDLLNEDDFIKKLPEYNPWKYLAVFYTTAFALLVVLGISLQYLNDDDKDLLIGIAMVALPTSSTFVMVFLKKQFITLPLLTIAIAILIMLGVYYIPFMAIATFSNNDVFGALTCGLVYIINFVLCSVIIMPIVNVKKKRLLKR